MRLSSRDRRVLAAGAIVVSLIVLVRWVVAPALGQWGQMGQELAPKLGLLEAFEARLDRREALLKRRSRLVREVGSLLGPVAEEAPKEGDAPPQGAEEEAGEAGSPAGEPPAPPALEAEVARIAKESKVQVKLVSARKSPRSTVALSHFQTAAVRVEAECQVEAMTKMLHALEKGERFVRIESLKLHQDLKKPGKLGVTMELAVYLPARAGEE